MAFYIPKVFLSMKRLWIVLTAKGGDLYNIEMTANRIQRSIRFENYGPDSLCQVVVIILALNLYGLDEEVKTKCMDKQYFKNVYYFLMVVMMTGLVYIPVFVVLWRSAYDQKT